MKKSTKKKDTNKGKKNKKESNTETQKKNENFNDSKNNNENLTNIKTEKNIKKILFENKVIKSKIIIKIQSSSNEEQYNYNTFCVFKSKDDIFYLVFINDKYNIIFYNIIDEKKVIEIFTHDNKIIELKYLFDEYNYRDLLFSISYKKLKLWDINNFECLFELKERLFCFYHLGFLKENERYNFIISSTVFEDDNEGFNNLFIQSLKNMQKKLIFDLNGNKLIDYKGYSKDIDFGEHKFIDTYYDKKLNKNYIFMFNDNYDIYSIDYQKNVLYKKYYSHNKPKDIIPFLKYKDCKGIENFRILFNESKNILKIIFPLYEEESIGVFNFHSGEIIYKIDLSDFIKKELFITKEISDIYSINFLNDNYISLSIAKNMPKGTFPNGQTIEFLKPLVTKHSLQIINLKDQNSEEVFSFDFHNVYIFVKNIYHPKYGECLLTQDFFGEILLMKIDL